MTLGLQLQREAHSFLAIAGLPGDIDIRFVFENAAEATTHQAVDHDRPAGLKFYPA